MGLFKPEKTNLPSLLIQEASIECFILVFYKTAREILVKNQHLSSTILFVVLGYRAANTLMNLYRKVILSVFGMSETHG